MRNQQAASQLPSWNLDTYVQKVFGDEVYYEWCKQRGKGFFLSDHIPLLRCILRRRGVPHR